MDFFCILYNTLENSLVDIFMRCLSYRIIKIHRKFTSAYLLCDKASLTTNMAMKYNFLDQELLEEILVERSAQYASNVQPILELRVKEKMLTIP